VSLSSISRGVVSKDAVSQTVEVNQAATRNLIERCVPAAAQPQSSGGSDTAPTVGSGPIS
jgi:hypothetical protein